MGTQSSSRLAPLVCWFGKKVGDADNFLVGQRGIKSSFCERRGLSWTSCGQMFCKTRFRTCSLCSFLPDSCFILLALGSQIQRICWSLAYLFLPLPRASRKELSTRSKIDSLSLSLLLHNKFLFFFFIFVYLTAPSLNCSTWNLDLHCSMWDLVHWPGIEP